MSKSGKIATITLTDKNGTTTAQVNDGQDGYTPQKGVDYDDGQDGSSAYASVSKSGNAATLTLTDTNGTTTAVVYDGEDGTTFTPSVSSAGVISWTNDGGKTNPESVDLVQAVLDALPAAEGVSF